MAFEDAGELCAAPGVDAVYIATPHQYHRDHAIMAAEGRKHIILEKPMALSLEDCDAIISAVDRSGVHLIVGHTLSYSPVVRAIRRVIVSGEFGRLGMINNLNYTNFLYRPRRPEELDTAQGGGILFNQVPHQVDSVRFLGGGMLRSVRAMTGVWDAQRATEGACMAFLEFEDGTAASIVYSGYDHFDSDEFCFWVGEGGQPAKPNMHGQARAALRAFSTPQAEASAKRDTGYGGRHERVNKMNGVHNQPHVGVLIVSCERADLRPSADGVLVYSDAGKEERVVARDPWIPGKGDVVNELYQSVFRNAPPVHDGRWGRATIEACLAIQRSALEHKEIFLKHQAPTPLHAA